MNDARTLPELILRLARLEQAGAWRDDLNPAQRAALAYLARANRFSRAPSQVAEYLGTTRGTASQTLKALRAKGYVTETPAPEDRRRIRYDVTAPGQAVLARAGRLEQALDDLAVEERATLTALLGATLARAQERNGGKPFGVCADCAHFRPQGEGGFCALLAIALAPGETRQICHEQTPRAA